MQRTILHSDCNSFYSSVECLKHPELRSRAVAVGGDEELRHGIILAKNERAKRCGVKTGEAIWQAKLKCPDLVVVPPAFDDYLKFSDIARQIYCDYTDQVEPFGLDEAWLDVTGEDGAEIAQRISRRIKFELGITVSIGVSFNKVFAKLGSDYRKPDAITLIDRANFRDIVWPLKIRDLLCVGEATERKLYEMGVSTIGQLATANVKVLHSRLGKNGEMLYCFANGLDSTPVAVFNSQPSIKSVGNCVTLPRDIVNAEEASRVLYVLADCVGRRLREQGLFGRCVTVNMRTDGLFCFTRRVSLPHPTDLTAEIHRHAALIARREHDWHVPLRSIGLSVSELSAVSSGVQLDMFTDAQALARLEKLEGVTDTLKQRFGNKCIVPASLLIDKKLTGFDPKRDHVIHPVGFLREVR